MVTFNGSFFIALIVIIFISVAKWLEWYLSERRATFFNHGKDGREEAAGKKSSRTGPVRKKLSRFAPAGKRLRNLFFFGEAKLKRPWYVGIPLFLFVFGNSYLNTYSGYQAGGFWLHLAFFMVGLIFIIGVETFGALRANREIFSERARRKRYVRTQFAQLLLGMLFFVFLLAGLLFFTEAKYTDPPGVKESVEWVIEPAYEEASWPVFSEGLAAVGNKKGKGFIDREGNVVIPFQYRGAGDFHDGLAAVKQGRKWGYIDKTGNVAIPFQYESAFEFSDGLAPVEKDGQWIVIDRTGAVRFKTDYESILPFHEGVARVEIRDKKHKKLIRFNLIDTEGKLLLPENYETWGNFSEGRVFVRDVEGNESFFADRDGKKAISLDLNDATDFSGGVAAVFLKSGDYALIDREGNLIKEIGETEYYDYMFCHEGLIVANSGGSHGYVGNGKMRYGFRDRYGNLLVPVLFRDVSFPSEGLIGIQVNGLWGFIENPLPAAARGVDRELWESDRTLIGNVEGIPVYAGELERRAFDIVEKEPALTGIPGLRKAFEQIKVEKAFEKYDKDVAPEEIRYQIGNSYYKKLLLENRGGDTSP